MTFVDPPEPPEGGGNLKAADLQNKVCLFRPTEIGEWPAKPEHTDENGKVWKAQGPRPYVSCDVWVLDRAGIVEAGTDVRVSWWKAVDQLQKVPLGAWVLAMPRKEDDSNAVVLVKTSRPEWRDIGDQAIKAIQATDGAPADQAPVDDYADGEEPF